MHRSRTRSPFSSIRLIAAALVLLPMLAASYAVSPALAQDATVRFAFWGDPAERDAYERVIAGFEAQNPSIKVEADYTPDQGNFQKKMATDFAGGNPPDVFLTNYRRFGQFAARGVLEPVGPYLAASSAISAEEYYPIAMDAFRYRGGEQTCMPQNVSSLVVYYNVDLFQAAGVPLPTGGWTWDEFTDAATALTRDLDGDGATDQFGVVIDPSMYRYVSFIWSAGGEIVDDLANPTTLTLDTPEALDAIEKVVSLGITGHNVVPSEAEALSEDDESRFMRGGAAMYVQSRRVVPTLREIEGFTWDVAPLPVIAEPATVLHSDAFCMAAAAKDKAAVWRFIEYAVGDAGQTILAENGRIVPSRISVANSDVFLKGTAVGSDLGVGSLALPPANSHVFLDNIEHLRRLPSISTWPEVEEAFDAGFKRAFYVEIDIEDAIEIAIFKSREAFQRAAEEDGVSP